MTMRQIQVPVSEELFHALKSDEADIPRQILGFAALEYYRERKLSVGKAAELAGMDKHEFTNFLGSHQVDIYRYTEKEWNSELETVEKIIGDKS
jgi:predicted HTH domain antitoxin